jgi:hypothetical protein
MDRQTFEQEVQAGDLIFLVTDHPSDRLGKRIIRSGIYEPHEDNRYGKILPLGQHVAPSGQWTDHGWDFSASPGSFEYENVLHAEVLIRRDQIADLVGEHFDALARSDYHERFG